MHTTTRSPGRPRAVLALLLTAAALVVSAATLAAPVGATSSGAAAPSVGAVAAEPGDTTTTLPRDNRVVGNSLDKPNSGADPVDAGDPGGWLQVSLFFLICGAILVMVGLVWFQSHRARRRREAAGLDPVSVAKSRGRGVRAPSPLASAKSAPGAGAAGSADAS